MHHISSQPMPYALEDRTGSNTNSDFDDIYDRLFFHINRQPGHSTTYIYEMPIRASRHRNSLPLNREPSVILEFLPDQSLGNITFLKHPYRATHAMSRYLRKSSLFGTSLTRKFIGSDGREYKWSYHGVAGQQQQWSCTTNENYLVAHYDLKAPNMNTFDVSGNTLTIYEPFAHLSLEIIATLIIMRHVAEHNL